jgi:N-acetylmuramoyl-L-alanine amidase
VYIFIKKLKINLLFYNVYYIFDINQKTKAMKIGKIVVDPGHGGQANIGGSDANHATSALGDLEKNLTLKISLLLYEALIKMHHEVKLTRDSDINLSLKDRATVAKDFNADALVSIHFNGWNDTITQGTETYIHTLAGDNSRLLASSVQQRLVSVAKYRDRGVKTMGLGVLKPEYYLLQTAACLAEISFITETTDARKLRDENYCKELANALAIAIDDYINKRSSINLITPIQGKGFVIDQVEDLDI